MRQVSVMTRASDYSFVVIRILMFLNVTVRNQLNKFVLLTFQFSYKFDCLLLFSF